jgi:peptidoglycan hydrolase CwlO-like protein
MGTRDTIKFVIIGCAFIGLISWNVVLQSKYKQHDNKFKTQNDHFEKLDGKLEAHESNLKEFEGKIESHDGNVKTQENIIKVSQWPQLQVVGSDVTGT